MSKRRVGCWQTLRSVEPTRVGTPSSLPFWFGELYSSGAAGGPIFSIQESGQVGIFSCGARWQLQALYSAGEISRRRIKVNANNLFAFLFT
jgi:hypothetical protein